MRYGFNVLILKISRPFISIIRKGDIKMMLWEFSHWSDILDEWFDLKKSQPKSLDFFKDQTIHLKNLYNKEKMVARNLAHMLFAPRNFSPDTLLDPYTFRPYTLRPVYFRPLTLFAHALLAHILTDPQEFLSNQKWLLHKHIFCCVKKLIYWSWITWYM